MYGFNKRYLIINNTIIDKKKLHAFRINNMLLNQLMSFYYNKDINCIDKKQMSYLLNKDIIIPFDSNYNPFVNLSDYNRYRLFVQLTNKCNLNCKHCYSNSGLSYEDYFNYEKAKDLVDEAIEKGVNRIDFTGGEVFTQKYFIDLVEYLDSKPVSYSIFSNLTLLSAEDIARIRKLSGLTSVITSIDYFDSERHNIFRGDKFAFQKTINSINMLRDSSIKIIINTMIMDDNHDDIIKLIDHFVPKGIKIHFDTIINCGRAKCKMNKDSERDYENVDFISHCINIIHEKHGVFRKAVDISCGVGRSLIFVNYKGQFNLCPGLTSEISSKYFMGNNLAEARKNLDKFSISCSKQTCEFYSDCSYGCRMRALIDSNDDCAPDYVLCHYQKLYKEKL